MFNTLLLMIPNFPNLWACLARPWRASMTSIMATNHCHHLFFSASRYTKILLDRTAPDYYDLPIVLLPSLATLSASFILLTTSANALISASAVALASSSLIIADADDDPSLKAPAR